MSATKSKSWRALQARTRFSAWVGTVPARASGFVQLGGAGGAQALEVLAGVV